MQLIKINKWFEKAGVFQLKHRTVFLCSIVLFSIVGIFGLTKLKVTDNQDEWFDDADQIQIDSDHFKDVFGNADSLLFLVESDDVFSPEVLDAIDRLGMRLEAEVPFADSLTSIMKLSVSRGTDDGFEIINPFEDGVPENSEELKAKKEFILSRTSLVNNLVSDDAKETWVILSLLPFKDDVEDQYLVGNAAIDILNSKEFVSDSYTLKAAGNSYTETEEHRVIEHEAFVRVLSGFMVMLLCLIFFVRSFRGVIVPLIATVFGIGSVLGFSGWLGISADSSLITLPILLGMALSVGYAIHYINSFRLHFRQSGKRKEAIIDAVRETGWPILFTVITTVGSMISFMAVGIGPLKWLGGICAAIVLAVYIYVILLIPILLSFGKDAKNHNAVTSEKDPLQFDKSSLRFGFFGEKVLHHRKSILISGAVVSVIAIFGMFKMSVNMDYIEMMGKKVSYVSRMLEVMNAKLGSQYSYNVMIEFEELDAFKNPVNMKNLDRAEEALSKLRLTRFSGNKPRITSVTDIVKEVNRTLNSDDEKFYSVPESQDMLTELLFLYEISGGEKLSDWLNEDYNTTFIHVDLSRYDANNVVKDIFDAKKIVQELFPDAKISIVGTVVNYAEMNKKLVMGELKSFMGSFIIIAILLIIAFGSVRVGLIGMIPNLAPVAIIGGLMGYAGFSLDMLTMTIMPMILGIAVDDTIHFMNHVKYQFEITGNYKEAILRSYREIGKTMTMTTVILCAMFLMYMFSPMNMLFRVGLLAIVGLFSALIADYTLTPVLIFMTKPFGKEKKN